MNKKVNTVLFMLGAMVFNVVTIIIIFLVFLVLLQWLVVFFIGENANILGILVIIAFILAMVGNFLLYRFMIRTLDKKFHLEQYLEPIFFKKRH